MSPTPGSQIVWFPVVPVNGYGLLCVFQAPSDSVMSFSTIMMVETVWLF